MRQLLVAFVAAAALVASQNSAQAVFEKVLIDNFTDPATPIHTSSPGSGVDGSETRASGGTSGNIYTGTPPGSGLSAVTTDIALDRGLSAQTPTTTPYLLAGGGNLGITGLGAGQSVGFDWDVNGYDFTIDNVVALLGLTNSVPVAALLQISMYQDGVLTDMKNVALGAFQTADVFFLASAIDTSTDFLGFEITNMGDQAFAGEIDRVIANPEPATMALMGLGVLGGAIGYRRRRKDDAVAPVEV